MEENLVVQLSQTPIIVTTIQSIRILRKNRQNPLEVTIENYDPRLIRIKQKEESALRGRGFRPVDESLMAWRGSYKSYPAQIFFPTDYPAVPLQWYWDQVPSGFHNVIGEQLCIEALLNKEAWAPDITIETIFEALDSHPFFMRR